MDTQLVEKIVHEVKSQGVFDEFRKDSMADVDTKPAYQNLRQRVETTVKKFLAEQIWTPETNKNQLREKLRRHITESGFLDVGVERIVDQVVNPKIGSVFQPRIEEIAYNYLGLPPPPKKYEPPPPPLIHPLPPLPIPPPPLQVETCSLLPNDLEQVSPDSDKATIKSEIMGDDKTEIDMETDDRILDDEDESPPFEPLITKEDVKVKPESALVKSELEDSTLGDVFKKEMIDTNSNNKLNLNEEIDSQGSNNVIPKKREKDECPFQDSQLSSVSSDTRLSPETKEDLSQPRSSQEEAATANISEEAQMPKFNENSCEPNGFIGCKKEKDSQLHFDINKDEIKFEGTDRKANADNNSSASPLMEESKCLLSAELCNKRDDFKFNSNNNSNLGARDDDGDKTPIADECSFGSSMENSTSISPDTVEMGTTNYKEKFMSMQEKSQRLLSQRPHQITIPTSMQVPTTTTTPTPTPTPTPPTPTPVTPTLTPTPSPVSTQKSEKDQQSSRHSSSSSSYKHKKHSKERRRSNDRDRDKDRHRSSSSKDSKYRSSSGTKGSSGSKHSSSSSNKNLSSHNKSSSDKDKDKEKDLEKSSSSSHSSKHSKHSSGDKRHHSSSSTHREHSSSSSTTNSGKRNERKDDHYESKFKPQRRKSTDSNDDDHDKYSGFRKSNGDKTNGQNYRTNNSSGSRTKSKSNMEVSSYNANETHNDQLSTESVYGDFGKPQPKNTVVFLNNLLENPETQFIELDTRGHFTKQSTTNSPEPNSSENPINHGQDLLYFEDIESTFINRCNLLNDTMDLCRRSVNCLRFECAVDEGIELYSEDDHNRSGTSEGSLTILKRKMDVGNEDFGRPQRKRLPTNKKEETSPSPSDSSVNSKENEEIDKNSDNLKKLERHKAIQKLSQQQRYSSDDLYKPRPILCQRSRRRGMDSIV